MTSLSYSPFIATPCVTIRHLRYVPPSFFPLCRCVLSASGLNLRHSVKGVKYKYYLIILPYKRRAYAKDNVSVEQLPPLTNLAEEERILRQYIKVVNLLAVGEEVGSSLRFFISRPLIHSFRFSHLALLFVKIPQVVEYSQC